MGGSTTEGVDEPRSAGVVVGRLGKEDAGSWLSHFLAYRRHDDIKRVPDASRDHWIASIMDQTFPIN